ncbi:MAG: ABC transporter permease [Planctomycetes bacterium]|nr:ABC transporter permease [Planctomycetota bacterium]
MNWLNAIRVGLKGLAVHKVRAALSMLGIIFGVASVVAVIAVSEGARGEMLKNLAALGANNIIVRGFDYRTAKEEERKDKKRARLRSEGMTLREARQVADSMDLIESFAPLRQLVAGVRCGEKPVVADVVGTTSDFLRVMEYRLREGRWINPEDEAQARRVCVLEDDIRKKAFPLSKAVGETIVIDHEPYTVVGVLESKATTDKKYTAIDIKQLNQRIYVPLTAGLLRSARNPLNDELTEVVYRCRSADAVDEAALILRRFYEASHGMSAVPAEQQDFKVQIARDLIRQVEEAQKIFNYVMLCSAGISLLVGGIGIMNIMLANVSERRREVGIRRSVGATQGDILKQFLLESLIICLVGGIAGCLVGIGFAYMVEQQTGWQTALAWWGMLMAVGVSLLDGVAFGTYPAWKAAKLDPIDALRYE